VFRRSSVLVLLVATALAVVPSALAVRVHVRVEGKTRTIFGASEPVLDVKATALDALESASLAGEFYYHVSQLSFGPYVDQVGRYPAAGTTGWAFKVNGKSPPVGADKVTLGVGDHVLWYYADFASGTGPKTLSLVRLGRNCYRAIATGDDGVGLPAAGAVLHVGSRRTVRTQGGVRCIGPHRGLLVRATLAGAVRSNAVR
jgi:hypothetical protein